MLKTLLRTVELAGSDQEAALLASRSSIDDVTQTDNLPPWLSFVVRDVRNLKHGQAEALKAEGRKLTTMTAA